MRFARLQAASAAGVRDPLRGGPGRRCNGESPTSCGKGVDALFSHPHGRPRDPPAARFPAGSRLETPVSVSPGYGHATQAPPPQAGASAARPPTEGGGSCGRRGRGPGVRIWVRRCRPGRGAGVYVPRGAARGWIAGSWIHLSEKAGASQTLPGAFTVAAQLGAGVVGRPARGVRSGGPGSGWVRETSSWPGADQTVCPGSGRRGR